MATLLPRVSPGTRRGERKGSPDALQEGVLDSRGKCASNRSVASWYDKCYITYADTNATNNYNYEVRSLDVLSDIPTSFDRSSHDQEFYSLLDRLVARAASAGGTGEAKFATGEAVYAPNGTMYGLAECMRDLSGEECNQCLQLLLTPMPSCCNGYQGGTVQNFNCRLRVQAYAYYDLALDAPPPAAAPPGPISSLVPIVINRLKHVGKRRLQQVILDVGISVGTLLVLVVVLACVFRQRRRIKANKENQDNAGDGMNYISLEALRAATSNFSINNKLGEGGFGEVFKFEWCMYVTGSEKAHQLDWTKRSMIISGIARGLLYLHQESRLKVIHRDLKPSNILLDLDMTPKISDFGLSRAFGGDQSMDITKRPVGTIGYMSPEYAYCGQVSTKSDMYSFGVIVLEIVTGRRNNRSVEDDTACRSLLSYVWEKWSAGSMEGVVDPSLAGRYPDSEVRNCVQIGLLCVQRNPSARPTASEVVVMLDSHSMSMTMRTPPRPAFCFAQPGIISPSLSYHSNLDAPGSSNDVTISDVQPR
ncbi:unnamed protein product [Triticum turgidum subsp. durum]|uniref:Cysteine-rich receptor-like protein kinase n=1 Tax=Triticum turgidum subsp. durum TaxID=4567 RepID=A0A9R0W2M5_TRITD|nr:unnamed protein product [Triticum turgidum subsp. durum]